MFRLLIILFGVALPLTKTSFVLAGPLVDLAWDSNGSFFSNQSVASKKFLEICGHLDSGDEIRWKFSSTNLTDFNIHYHAEGKVFYPNKRNKVLNASDILKVSSSQGYCWMWSNPGQTTVEVKAQLQKVRP